MDAQTYRKTVGDTGITPEIQALADEITAGLTNDFDKAEALEKWFGDDGFVYDLSYAPAEHTPNYFLLESKRGICSDYASALTLLARAVSYTHLKYLSLSLSAISRFLLSRRDISI